MKRLVLFFLVQCAVLMAAASPAEDLKAGNDAYRDGKFGQAVVLYEKVVSSGEISWTVFFNLGNAYYKNGQLSKAILNYEKALRLNPTQEDARFNLKLANQQITDRRPDYADTGLMGIWNSVVRTFTVDGWAWVSIGLFSLIFIFLVLVYVVPNGTMKRILFGFTFLWLVLGGFALVFAQDLYSAFYKKDGVIMADAVNIGSEPKENSTPLFVLHSGTKVAVLDESGDFYKVQFDPEKIGWIPKADIAMIDF
jgi:tetratricopeptide (TPR) repeat protein